MIVSISFRRSAVFIALALALPVLVFLLALVLVWLGRERDDVEAAARANAAQIMAVEDAHLSADLAALEFLAADPAVRSQDHTLARARIRDVALSRPNWRNVVLSDAATGRPILALRGERSAQQATLIQTPNAVGGISMAGDACPCVTISRQVQTVRGATTLTIVLDPAPFQDALLAHALPGAVAAVVDREGNFIARTINYRERLGTPASQFVRSAIASGRAEGIYRGRTFEGFENYTAYNTSPLSGWSTHTAIDHSLIALPRDLSLAAAIGGGIAALVLSAALIFLSLRELERARVAEARLAQAQKLEALGQLTGGVAHDFNNLLTVILGAMSMLRKRPLDDRSQWIVEHVREAAERGEKLTKQLLAFARHQRLEIGPVDLRAVVRGMQTILAQSVGATVTVQYELDEAHRHWVLSDATQMELALLNLAVNARDAMPAGGVVNVSIADSRSRPGFVELVVSDNGSGIPKHMLARVTEPFFTTKPQGKGTGLGLAQVFGAVTQSGGTIEIESELGVGTTVRLFFQVADPPLNTPIEPKRSTTQKRALNALVVDDEPGVRAFMVDTLRAAGHHVVEAEDAIAALAFLDGDSVDVLITDFAMPEVNGLTLAERARARRPDLNVLIVSGYADFDALAASPLRPALLTKPFDELALLDAVERVTSDALAAQPTS